MNDRPGYEDAEAKRIIQRAAEIDAERGHQLNVPALREIAAQAGISPLAVDQAIEEHESAASAQAPWPKRHRTLLIIAAIVVGLVLYAFVLRTPVPPP